MRQFAESLDIVRGSSPVDAETLDAHFAERRHQLNEYVECLHQPRAPSGMSVYELQANLMMIEAAATTRVRWSRQQLVKLTAAVIHYAEELLKEASTRPDLFLGGPEAVWTGAALFSPDEVTNATNAVTALSGGITTRFSRAAEAFSRESGMPGGTLAEIDRAVELGNATSAVASLYGAAMFDENLAALAGTLAPARHWVTGTWSSVVNPVYRRARTRVRGLRFERAPDKTLLSEVENAAALVKRWREHSESGSKPVQLVSFPELRDASLAFHFHWQPLRALLAWGDVMQTPLAQIGFWIGLLDAQKEDAYRLPRLREIEGELERLGLGLLMADLRDRRPHPDLWVQILRHAYYRSCLESAWLEERRLATFDSRYQTNVVNEFRRLDRRRTELAAQRIRRAHAQRAVVVRDHFPEQDAVVREQAKRKTRHKTVRALVSEAPDIVTALRPCWMASPLAVSQLLGGSARIFDVVIFDEASQVLPEDAVTSILRGRTLVVAGDDKQLPPTPFFASGVEQEGLDRKEAEAVEGFESVLEILGKVFDPWDLKWHYRSVDERLIAFSNHHIYGDRLVAFPGVGLVDPVRFIEVEEGSRPDGQEESSSAEVERVVDLVLEHAAERPNESLGVIATGVKHANRIEAQLRKRRLEAASLDEFFNNVQNPEEPFFVKNLERVQGDERDGVILSIGYGKNRAGNLGLNFGPLTNSKTGHRRLNVAVTRAKRRVTVVASFNPADMDPKRLNALGMKLVKAYLEYAASGGNSLGNGAEPTMEMNGFEQSVFNALESRGMSLIAQHGVGGYRVDFVVQHPERRGRLVMAIECDGASYHSAYTARDRDRLRQEHLERLGWHFCRIWSPAWFGQQDVEIERVLRAYEDAVREADAESEQTGDHSTSGSVKPSPHAEAPRSVPTVGVPSAQTWRTGQPIDSYKFEELKALESDVRADGLLRTKEEMIREMSRRLGYERLHPKVRARLGAVLQGYDLAKSVRVESTRGALGKGRSQRRPFRRL